MAPAAGAAATFAPAGPDAFEGRHPARPARAGQGFMYRPLHAPLGLSMMRWL